MRSFGHSRDHAQLPQGGPPRRRALPPRCQRAAHRLPGGSRAGGAAALLREQRARRAADPLDGRDALRGVAAPLSTAGPGARLSMPRGPLRTVFCTCGGYFGALVLERLCRCEGLELCAVVRSDRILDATEPTGARATTPREC